jgi:hypothetical protein
MISQRKIEWLVLAATAGLLMLMKWLHLGVIHYNWFMIILIAWCLGLVIFFRFFSSRYREHQASQDS